jgi:hypothetical protein
MIVVLSILLISVTSVTAPAQLAHSQRIDSHNVFNVANTSSTIQAIGTAAPGNTSSPPSISNWGPNHLNAFVLGSDGSIWNNFFNGIWHTWVHTGNPGDPGHPPNIAITSAPAAISRDIIRRNIDVFARGSDNGIWRLCTADGANWNQWKHIGNHIGIVNVIPSVVCFGTSSLIHSSCSLAIQDDLIIILT